VIAIVLDGPERARDVVERDAAVAADVVLRVVRDHEMTPGRDHPRADEADLLVLRHRRGPIAAVTVAFQGHYARFVDMPLG
jgi:replicative DNA helicase